MRTLLLTCFFLLGQSFLFAQDFNLLDFGALPDGKTLNTKAIQAAIDAVHQKGGGRLIVPAGRFVTGSIQMKSNVELHLQKEAVLLGSTQPDDYIKLNRWKGFVLADGQDNIAITGPGEIDGRGREVALRLDSLFFAGQIDSSRYNFVEMRPKYYTRPQLIEFVNCTNIEFREVRLKNAACWVQTLDRCKNIVIDGIHIDSDAYWNNDGIDISDCQNVRITNCTINAADDGLCLKSHSENYFCDSIYIANCSIRSSASAVKFGTRSHGGFKNVVIEHIKVYDTFRSAIAIESVDGGILENITINDIQATNTGNAIFIRLGHRTKRNPVGTLKNILIKNIKVEVAFERPDYAYEIRGPALPFFHNTFPSSITGIPGHPVENVTLENIEIIYPGKGNNGLANRPLSRLDEIPEEIAAYPEFSMFGELPAWGFYVRHVDGLKMKNVKVRIKEADYRPAFIFDDARNVTIQSTHIIGDEKDKHFILHNTANVHIDKKEAVLNVQ